MASSYTTGGTGSTGTGTGSSSGMGLWNDDSERSTEDGDSKCSLGIIVEENDREYSVYDVPLDNSERAGIVTDAGGNAVATTGMMSRAAYRDDAHGSLPHVEELKLSSAATTSGGSGRSKLRHSLRGRRKLYLLGAVVVLILILLIAIPSSKRNRNSKSSATTATGSTGTNSNSNANTNSNSNTDNKGSFNFANRNSTIEAVFQFLKEQQLYLVDMPYIEKTAQTPQHKAAAWLSREDHANLNVPSKDADTMTKYLYLVRYVMAVNYFALDGHNTWVNKLNFMSKNNVCKWQSQIVHGLAFRTVGVFCDKQNIPHELSIYSNNLKGTIPTENGLLTSLTHLDFSSNAITGTIPTYLCYLSNLRKLDVALNMIGGYIPPCIGTTMSNLESLYLYNNILDGTIPTHIVQLKQLKNFIIEENHFTGNPISIWNNMTELQVLYANRNNFTGIINKDFFQWHKSLTVLDVSHNQFTYDLIPGNNGFPHHLLTLKNLTHLDLSNNPLQGSFPKDLFPKNVKNHKLVYFSMHDTKMNGSLPDLHQLITIKHLDLSKNNFHGVIPQYYGANNTHLELLYLSDNVHMSPSQIPSNFVNLSKLRDLSLRGAGVHGAIPSFIGTNLTNLVLLDLGLNNLTDTVPASLALLTKLEYLLLNGNLNLTGSLHPVTVHHPQLKVLLIDGTKIKLPSINCPAPVTIAGIPQNVSTLKVYTDCETSSLPTCSCCRCCTIADGLRCSKPLLTSIDGSWLQTFDRKTYVLFEDDEHN